MGIYEQILEMEKEETREQTELKTKTKVVLNLLCNTDLTIKTIADSAEVSVDFVIEIKNSLTQDAQ